VEEIEVTKQDGVNTDNRELASVEVEPKDDPPPTGNQSDQGPTTENSLEKVKKFVEKATANLNINLALNKETNEAVQNIQFPDENGILSTEDSLFGKCEQYLPEGTDWSDVANTVRSGGRQSDVASLFKFSFVKELRYFFVALQTAPLTNQGFAEQMSKSLTEAKAISQKIQLCTALAFMTDKVDYESAEAKSIEGVDSIKRSFDQKIVAKKNGVETQDFPACSKAIDMYNAAFIGGEAMKVGQTFQFQEASMDASIKAQENANDITSGMQAQKDMTDEQKKITDTRAAFSGAKMAALYAALGSIPTQADLMGTCNRKMTESAAGTASPYTDLFTRYKNSIVQAAHDVGISITVRENTMANMARPGTAGRSGSSERAMFKFTHEKENEPAPATNTAGSVPGTPPQATGAIRGVVNSPSVETNFNNKRICEQPFKPNQKVSLIMNEVSCRQKIKTAMIKAGVDVADNLLKSKLLDDQSDRISDAINNVKKFDEDNAAPTFEEFNAEICQADPTLPECAAVGPVFDRGREFNGNGINVSGFSRQNTSAGIQREDSSDSSIDSETDDGKRGEGVTGVGTTVGTPKNSTAFIDPSPGAGSMKRGGGGGAGGGGGGGVGKAASSGGGGGGSGGGGSRGGTGISGRKISYSGGGGGLSFGGGGKGRSKKSGSKGGNPFSKFFKNKKGSKKGGTLNFRGVASVGGKKDSLFGMISNRYGKLKDERLIKYKAEK
jgi:hypothetical protein